MRINCRVAILSTLMNRSDELSFEDDPKLRSNLPNVCVSNFIS